MELPFFALIMSQTRALAHALDEDPSSAGGFPADALIMSQTWALAHALDIIQEEFF
jgi:hypothetical protein